MLTILVFDYAPHGRKSQLSASGLGSGLASLWLAAFAVVSGIVMVVAGRFRTPRLHKPFLVLGVALMGLGFLAIAASSSIGAVSLAVVPAAVGFGLISTLGY